MTSDKFSAPPIAPTSRLASLHFELDISLRPAVGGMESSNVELTSEQFEQITGVGDAESVCSVENERRKNPRIAFGMRAKIKPLFQQGAVGKAVMVRDMSRSGIGLLCSEPMNVSDEFVCTLPTQAEAAMHIHCIVVRCDRGGCGGAHHVVGATFELVIENAAMVEGAGDGEMVVSETVECAALAEPVAVVDPSSGAKSLLTSFACAASAWSRVLGCFGLGREAWRIRNRLRSSSQKRSWKFWSRKSAVVSERPGKEPLACPPQPAPIDVRIDLTPIPVSAVPVARLASLFAQPAMPAVPAEVAAPAAVAEGAAAPEPVVAPAPTIEPPAPQSELTEQPAAAPVAEIPPKAVEIPAAPVVDVASPAELDAAPPAAQVPSAEADVENPAPVASTPAPVVQPASPIVEVPPALLESSKALSGGTDRLLAPSRKLGEGAPVSKSCVCSPRHPRRRTRR